MTKYIDPTIKGNKLGKMLSVIEICVFRRSEGRYQRLILRMAQLFIFANLVAMALNVRQTQMNMNRAFKVTVQLLYKSYFLYNY